VHDASFEPHTTHDVAADEGARAMAEPLPEHGDQSELSVSPAYPEASPNVPVALPPAEVVAEAAAEALPEVQESVESDSTAHQADAAAPGSDLPLVDAVADDVDSLRAALARTPNDSGLLVRLASLLAQNKEVAAFTDVFYDMRTLTDSEGEDWARVLKLGRELDPDNPLFQSPEERAAARARDLEERAAEARRVEAPPAESAASPPDPRMKSAMAAIDLSLPSDREHAAPVPLPDTTPASMPAEESPVGSAAESLPAAPPVEAPPPVESSEPAQIEPLPPTSDAADPMPAFENTPAAAPAEADPDDEPARPDGLPRMASVAGQSAVKFGVLDLDFDLDLPDQSTHSPVMADELDPIAVARNKLELAHEYVALGEVAGARSLINEVVDSNDPATREAARALLGSLAPLS